MILTFCSKVLKVFGSVPFSHECRLLVYEYCENGSLKEHLHQDGDYLNPNVRVCLLSPLSVDDLFSRLSPISGRYRYVIMIVFQEQTISLSSHKWRVLFHRPSKARSHMAKTASDCIRCCNWFGKHLQELSICPILIDNFIL